MSIKLDEILTKDSFGYDLANLFFNGSRTKEDNHKCWINLLNHFQEADAEKIRQVDTIRNSQINPFVLRRQMLNNSDPQMRFFVSSFLSLYVLSGRHGRFLRSGFVFWMISPEFFSAFA